MPRQSPLRLLGFSEQRKSSERVCIASAADEEDSYTKEETKTPKFVNLVHAASIQKQASQAVLGPVPVASGTPRAQPAANGNGPSAAAQGPSEADRSALVTSSLPEPLNDQQVTNAHACCPVAYLIDPSSSACSPMCVKLPVICLGWFRRARLEQHGRRWEEPRGQPRR